MTKRTQRKIGKAGPVMTLKLAAVRTSRAANRSRRTAACAARLLALGAALLALPGCQTMNVGQQNLAEVRFIAASADAPGLDLQENGAVAAYDVGFGTPTSYVPLQPGVYRIAALDHGSGTPLAAGQATLAGAHHYTAMFGDNAVSLTETLLEDQNRPAPAGQIAFRLLNQATRAGRLDIYLVPSGGRLSATTPLATNLSFGANTGYLNVPAGSYGMAVVPAGTLPVSAAATLYTGDMVEYTAGDAGTVVLIDRQGATTPAVAAIVADDYSAADASK